MALRSILLVFFLLSGFEFYLRGLKFGLSLMQGNLQLSLSIDMQNCEDTQTDFR